MAEFSNPLKRGLQQMHVPGAIHPDADLLTAFAEQSLTKREREQVLAHLAWCADCRDVLACSLPDVPLAVPSAEPVKPLFWRWPILRWAAVAASVVIVVLAVAIGNVERHQREKQNQQVAEVHSTPVPGQSLPAQAPQSKVEASLPQIAGSSGVQRPKVRYERIPGDSQTAALPSLAKERADNLPATEPEEKADNLAVGKIVAGVVAPQAQPPAAVDESVNSTVYKRDPTTYTADARMKAAVPPPPPPPVPSANETVEVSSDAVQVESTKTAPASGGPMPASNKPETRMWDARQSIQLDKDASKKQLTRFAAATNWRISNGLLQRSFDSGQTWEQARPEANFRVVSTIGNEIWAGGANGVLLHSADAGQSWSTVSPGMKGDVSSLQFIDAKHGVAKTSTETWETTDGGKSWKKQ